MLQNALKNWQTTSAGLTMIIGSAVHLVFSIKAGAATETVWTVSLGAMVAGVGLIAAGDAKTSAANHDETKQALTALAQAVKTGNTEVLSKSDLTNPQTTTQTTKLP